MLLIAIAVIGLRAGRSFSDIGRPAVLNTTMDVLYWALVGTGTALVLIELAVAVVLVIRKRGLPVRPPVRRPRTPWWLLALPVAVFVLPRILAALRRRFHASTAKVPAHAHPRGAGSHLLLPPGSYWPLLVGLGVAALAAGALVISARRSSRPPRAPQPAPVAAEPLVAALAAGAGALRDDTDPRQAIVGCYAAMERSLAEAGAPPSAADTPAEVLARAGAGGLVRSSAAETLTGLFRLARYSRHPVTEADRALALDALAQLRADLEVLA